MNALKRLLPWREKRVSQQGSDVVPAATASQSPLSGLEPEGKATVPASSDDRHHCGTFCTKCAEMISAFPSQIDPEQIHSSYITVKPPKPWKWSNSDLEKGHIAGCHFCPKLQGVKGSAHSISVESIQSQTPRLSKITEKEFNVDGYWTMSLSVGGDKRSISFFPSTEDDSDSCNEYIPEKSTASDSTISLIKQWIDECVCGHTRCPKNEAPNAYPTRLLEIVGTNVRLIDTAAEAAMAPFVALSHCWGKNMNNLVLTSDNEEQLRQGLQRDQLPLTFRDAVEITDRLGFKYIWIDSLCIFQAGPEKAADWGREVRLMSSVYSNSILNLAAADSRNSSAGMFRTRSADAARPFVARLPTAVQMRERSLRWGIRAADQPHILISSDVIEHSVGHFPLDERAWVCQERLLSARTVHFSQDQVYWECSETPFACESLPCGIDTNHILVQARASMWALEAGSGKSTEMTDLNTAAQPMLQAPARTWKLDDAISQSQRWYDILTDFTQRQLTVPGDKLPAIGAVAQKVGESLGDEYVHGCFKSLMPQALLWRYKAPIKPAKPTSYLAPSWSWASTTQPLIFDDCYWISLMRMGRSLSFHAMAKLIDLHAVLTDAHNPFGEVKEGYVVLRGPLVQTEVTDEVSVTRLDKGRPRRDMEVMASQVQIFLFDETGDKKRFGTNLYFLPIAWRVGHGRVMGAPYMREYGLLLTRRSDDAYVRVGTFRGEHMSAVSKSEAWRYGTKEWGYPEDMLCDVKIV